MASDRSIIIKGAHKSSSVVVWNRVDYILETEKCLNDKRVYKEAKFNENVVTDFNGYIKKISLMKIFLQIWLKRVIRFLIVCAAID